MGEGISAAQMGLYALSALNALLMALLMFYMRSGVTQRDERDRQIAEVQTYRDREMREAMTLIVRDLKTLNDAVLGDYIPRKEVELMITTLREDQVSRAEAHRLAMHEIRDLLHGFEVALVAHGVQVRRKTDMGGK